MSKSQGAKSAKRPKLQSLKPRLQMLGTRIATLPANPMATPRQRGSGWMKRRARLLSASPLCCMCAAKGVVSIATEVDHVVPLHKGGPDTDENTQNLCGPCHKLKTAEDLEHKVRQTIGLDGWPV